MSDWPIEHQLGISTHFIPATHGESLEQAADAVAAAGFAGLEIVPAEAQAQIGYPYNLPNVGLWPREFSQRQRRALRARLGAFRFCTIHGPHLDLNIASANRGIREESVRQYLECMDLAADLGIEVVTFHMGRPTPGFVRAERDLLAHDVAFARQAVEYARERGLRVGFETGAVARLREVLEAVPEMGVNLDLGHVVMQGAAPETLIREWAGRLMEVHFNGVVHYWGGFMEHVPVHRNNAIDYGAVTAAVRGADFRGPIVFELQGNDLAQVIAVCAEAREMLRGLWSGALHMPQRWYVAGEAQ